MEIPASMNAAVMLAGIGQLIIVVGSLAIPRALNWNAETAKLRPLTRQVFWTYAGYIWVTNLCFGLLSALAPQCLLDGSPLAAAVSAFIAFYWGARLIIQFAYFDRRDAPSGIAFRVAESVLVAFFLFFTATYGYVAVLNFRGTP